MIFYDYKNKWLSIVFFDVENVFQGYLWNGNGDPNKLKGYIIE